MPTRPSWAMYRAFTRLFPTTFIRHLHNPLIPTLNFYKPKNYNSNEIIFLKKNHAACMHDFFSVIRCRMNNCPYARRSDESVETNRRSQLKKKKNTKRDGERELSSFAFACFSQYVRNV